MVKSLLAPRRTGVLHQLSGHGRSGDGRGPGAPPGAQLPDLRSPAWQTGRTDAQIADVIRQGRGLMPPFGKQITEEGIVALIEHIRGMKAPPP